MISSENIFIVVAFNQIILVNLLIITIIVFFSFDFGSGPIMSILISCHMLQSIPQGCIMKKGKGYDNMIGYTIVVSVSASYSRCYNLTLSLKFPHII